MSAEPTPASREHSRETGTASQEATQAEQLRDMEAQLGYAQKMQVMGRQVGSRTISTPTDQLLR